MKYVVVKLQNVVTKRVHDFMFTFPHLISHDMFYKNILELSHKKTSVLDFDFKDAEAVSAGFIDSNGVCFGESATLSLKSRGAKDTAIFKSEHGMGFYSA